MTTAANPGGAGESAGGSTGNQDSQSSSRARRARVMVRAFSHAKLPEHTSHSWVTITMTPATPATGCGAKSSHGTTNWATWLAATSTRCSDGGRRGKDQLDGAGIGWGSWGEVGEGRVGPGGGAPGLSSP